jgi:hypothetical protein
VHKKDSGVLEQLLPIDLEGYYAYGLSGGRERCERPGPGQPGPNSISLFPQLSSSTSCPCPCPTMVLPPCSHPDFRGGADASPKSACLTTQDQLPQVGPFAGTRVIIEASYPLQCHPCIEHPGRDIVLNAQKPRVATVQALEDGQGFVFTTFCRFFDAHRLLQVTVHVDHSERVCSSEVELINRVNRLAISSSSRSRDGRSFRTRRGLAASMVDVEATVLGKYRGDSSPVSGVAQGCRRGHECEHGSYRRQVDR